MTATALAQHSIDIQQVLSSAGVEISKVGEREITGKCPVHIRTTGKVDGHPSWSINAETGLWICFSCGARGTLPMLLSELYGDDVDVIGVQKLLMNSGAQRLFNPPQESDVERFDPYQFHTFSRVADSRCIHRYLDPDMVFLHGVRWNKAHKSWAIPIMSPTGMLTGWQEKRTGYVRNFPVGVEKSTTLFGIERFRSKTAVLVESPLDVVRFAGLFSRPQALASFGAFVSDAQLNLIVHVADTIIIALDNDKAGKEASKNIYKRISRPRKALRWWNYSNTTAKDIGDMSDTEIEQGLCTATVLPPWV
jgi:hypothetical protein